MTMMFAESSFLRMASASQLPAKMTTFASLTATMATSSSLSRLSHPRSTQSRHLCGPTTARTSSPRLPTTRSGHLTRRPGHSLRSRRCSRAELSSLLPSRVMESSLLPLHRVLSSSSTHRRSRRLALPSRIAMTYGQSHAPHIPVISRLDNIKAKSRFVTSVRFFRTRMAPSMSLHAKINLRHQADTTRKNLGSILTPAAKKAMTTCSRYDLVAFPFEAHSHNGIA